MVQNLQQDVQVGRGKYIVVDGIDGGGKTTLFESLHKTFPMVPTETPFYSSGASGNNFIYTREPGGTLLGEKIRELLLNDEMDPYTQMCLFTGQRREVRNMIETQLRVGRHIISDRSESSTFGYQICGHRLETFEKLFWEMNKDLEPFPDFYIFLDLPPDVAFQRLNNRGGAIKPDVFERMDVNYFERVRNGFLKFPTKVSAPCVFVDATKTKEEVATEVINHIRSYLFK